MRIWLVSIGEPIPTSADSNSRLLRTGYFANLLSQYGNDVIWWTSAFDHFRKTQLCTTDTDLVINQHLTIRLLCGSGYKSHVSLRRVWDHWKISRKFSSAIKKQTMLPDIILAALPTIDLCYESVVFGNQQGIPVVLDMRDMWPDIFVDLAPDFLRPLTRRLLSYQFRRAGYACEKATAIIGITDEFVAWGLKRGQRCKQEFDKSFPFGYSIQAITRESEENAIIELNHRGIHFDDDNLYALYIGSLSRNANLGDIISASRILYEQNSKWKFIVCGDGDCVDLILNHISKYPNVKYGGWVDRTMIHSLMRRCHVGLNQLPDRYDFLATINNKAIEYMSAGLPIISSPDRGVLCELLKMHECGISYPSGDAGALASTLTRFYDDQGMLRKMSQNAMQLFQERFIAEKIYTEMMEHLVMIAENQNQSVRTGGQDWA
ncbi:MAG: glycosyltransferase family 4 protein [Desulfomonilia bacterium]|jgi:glycosyltransferase involved in cell wall biosynthesis